MPKGHFVRTEEHKRRISEALMGIKRSDETKAKISALKTGIVYSQESREKSAVSGISRTNGAGKYERTPASRRKQVSLQEAYISAAEPLWNRSGRSTSCKESLAIDGALRASIFDRPSEFPSNGPYILRGMHKVEYHRTALGFGNATASPSNGMTLRWRRRAVDVQFVAARVHPQAIGICMLTMTTARARLAVSCAAHAIHPCIKSKPSPVGYGRPSATLNATAKNALASYHAPPSGRILL